MASCEGPISIGNGRRRWLCRGAKTILRVDLYKKLFPWKPWCVEGGVIRGVYVDPVGSGCFQSRAAAEEYVRALQAQTSPTLAGLHSKRLRRRRRRG